MDIHEFRATAHQMVDWMADYFESIENYPVKSQVTPGEIFQQLPAQAPSQGQSMKEIMEDFEKIILPGMTHWQHPNFHAYFSGNSSYPSLLAEMLTATLGAQCMLWETSPAATELEEKMMEWLKDLLHLPDTWKGVIQDTASTATLVSLLTARERHSSWQINRQGFHGQEKYRIYCSNQAHSSVEKAVRIAGFGSEHLVKVQVDQHYALSMKDLKLRVTQDLAQGCTPLWITATLGTTGSTSVDPLWEMGQLCQEHGIWLHVDAAWAGTALMLPSYQWMGVGMEMADSFVFNAHKWMFTNFDCSAYFVKDSQSLKKTFTLVPEYLKTQNQGRVNNYSEWGIQLGRRFRALKLWFVMRSFGKEELREKISNHIAWAGELAQKIHSHDNFELMAAAPLATVCFRFRPGGSLNPEALNVLNERLLQALNATGKIYMTHTKLDHAYTLRLVVGQTYLQKKHLEQAWELILKVSAGIE